MRLTAPARRLLLTVWALLATAGCGGGGSDGASPAPPGTGLSVGQQAPEFALTDVNAASATFGTEVAPSGSAGRTSAWYFGWAT